MQKREYPNIYFPKGCPDLTDNVRAVLSFHDETFAFSQTLSRIETASRPLQANVECRRHDRGLKMRPLTKFGKMQKRSPWKPRTGLGQKKQGQPVSPIIRLGQRKFLSFVNPQWAKISSSGQPARSSLTRVGRKSKQAWASSVRPSLSSISSNNAFS